MKNIIRACQGAENKIERLDLILKPKPYQPADEPCIGRGYNSLMCIEEVTTLLQHLNVLIRKHDEDTLQELKLTRYYRVFSAETSDRHDTVRDAIYDIHNFVETETNKYDEMLKNSDAYTETEHLKKYVALREVAKLLFKERVPSAAAATCTVAEPKQGGAVTEPASDDAVGGKRARYDDATEPARL